MKLPKEVEGFIKKPSFWLTIAVLAALLGGYVVYSYTTKSGILPDTNKSLSTEEETKKLVERVGKIILLPTGETPTLATVADREKLANQQFFVNSQNGDKVLIYQKARKAVIYRPSTNQIIEVGPVNIAPPTQASSSVTQVQTPYKFIILNGTKTVGLTKKFETILKGKILNTEVLDRDNAKNDTYEKSIIIDLSGVKKDLAASIAKSLNIDVSELPKGEVKPEEGDFLIILGSDQTKTASPTPTIKN